MKILVLIPIYNYFDILKDLVSFYNENLDEADVIIINDGENVSSDLSLELSKNYSFDLINNKKEFQGDLRYIYSNYFISADYDCIIINEHDVMPNVESLYACLEAFLRFKSNLCVSVSCMYKWKDKLCYPANPNWLKEIPIENDHLGHISRVGRQGVPFAFSLWKPSALRLINTVDTLPKIWKLDTEFGIMLHSFGFYHIRLKDYYIDHINNGIRSWKQP